MRGGRTGWRAGGSGPGKDAPSRLEPGQARGGSATDPALQGVIDVAQSAMSSGPSEPDEAGADTLKAVLASPCPHRRQMLVEGLGEDVDVRIASLDSQDALLSTLAGFAPDVLIMACIKPSGPILHTLGVVMLRQRLPIVVFSEDPDTELGRRALRAGVSAYIVDGLSPARVRPIVDLAIERFRLVEALHTELRNSKDELAARKSIERAKGLLMERRGLSEADAYNSMRQLAMTQRKTIREVAEMILSISDILP